MDRRYRLTLSTQFQRVCRHGRSGRHQLLVLCWAANQLSHSRFGFLVSKRVGNAVVRNRVKRLMREAVRARRSKIPPGWDFVLIARAPIVKADLRRIGEALDCLLPRAGPVANPSSARGTSE